MIEQQGSKVCTLCTVAHPCPILIKVLGWVKTKVQWCASLQAQQEFDRSWEVL